MDQVGTVIPVVKVNVDYEADSAQRANVRSVPTVILVENDQEVRRFTGARSYEQIMQFING
jgi:thioredoxin-like negative regulator of GroEL